MKLKIIESYTLASKFIASHKQFIKCNKLRKRYRKGSLTIEASIIVPTLIFLIIALIVSFMILYQKAVLVKTAALSAQQGAEIWIDSRKGIENGCWDVQNERDSLYYRLFDTSVTIPVVIDMQKNEAPIWEKTGNKIRDIKILKIINSLEKGLSRGLMKPEITRVEFKYNNTLIQGKIEVTLTQEIKIPLGWIKSLFDGKDRLVLEAKGVALVEQPAEYIRNIDLALEYADRIKNSSGFQDIISGLKSKLK